MITENGIVTQADQAVARIKTNRSAACESCSTKDSCGTKHHGSKEMMVTVKNTIGVKAGDAVVIGMETRPMIILSFLTYVFPVILLLIGALIGDSLAPVLGVNKSFLAMGLGFSSFAMAFFVLRKKQNSLSAKAEFKPFLVRKKSRSAADRCSIL
jgi:sigma-E factor negative regulatory protein RseC